MKGKATTAWPLPPTEWDFRDIDSWEYGPAIHHEFSREIPGQMKQAAEILATRKNAVPGWHKETIAVIAYRFGVGTAMTTILHWIAGMSPNVSWKEQPRDAKLRLIDMFYPGESKCRITDYPRGSLMETIDDLKTYVGKGDGRWDLPLPMHPGRRQYLVEIDWDSVNTEGGMEALKKQFLEQLPLMNPVEGRSKGRQKTSLELLTALAAMRLKSRGISRINARQLVTKLSGKDSSKETIRGLPCHGTNKGWSMAIKSAESFLKEFTSPPEINSPK